MPSGAAGARWLVDQGGVETEESGVGADDDALGPIVAPRGLWHPPRTHARTNGAPSAEVLFMPRRVRLAREARAPSS